MSFPIEVRVEADLDAIDSYNELRKAYDAISRDPQHYSFISSSSSMCDIAIKRFPFTVIFEFNEESVVIYASYHGRKCPIRF